MLPSDVKLVPVTTEQRLNATAIDICRSLIERDEDSDPYQFNGEVVSAVSGECIKLDMDKAEDRAEYADLMAQAVVSPDSTVVLWEERVKKEEGGLIIYLCYINTKKTASGSLK